MSRICQLKYISSFCTHDINDGTSYCNFYALDLVKYKKAELTVEFIKFECLSQTAPVFKLVSSLWSFQKGIEVTRQSVITN